MIVVTSTMFEGAGASISGTHLCCGGLGNSKQQEMKMNAFAKLAALVRLSDSSRT
jgi:hypothetical protein